MHKHLAIGTSAAWVSRHSPSVALAPVAGMDSEWDMHEDLGERAKGKKAEKAEKDKTDDKKDKKAQKAEKAEKDRADDKKDKVGAKSKATKRANTEADPAMTTKRHAAGLRWADLRRQQMSGNAQHRPETLTSTRPWAWALGMTSCLALRSVSGWEPTAPGSCQKP